MTRAGGNISALEQRALVDIGIELLFADGIVDIPRPAHEICHSAGWPVAIEDLEDETLRSEVAGNFGQSVRRGLGQQAPRRLVGVDRPTDEIVRAGVAHVEDEARNHCAAIDEGDWSLLAAHV